VTSTLGRRLLGLAGIAVFVFLVLWARSMGHPDDLDLPGPGTPQSTASIMAPGSGTGADGQVAVTGLPAEVPQTLALIESGGPFPYRQDGSTFGNRERLLPVEPAGYYREYTVPTPGSRDRGARRIVLGESGETYYTGDHYRSFTRIDLRE